MADSDYENRSHGTASTSPTAMLRRGQVRVEVPENRINGQHRVVIDRAGRWLVDELRLPFLTVSYFLLQERVWDQRDAFAEYQAELGETLSECSTFGYVEWSLPTAVNIRADQTLPDLLEVLAHEARHCKQALDFDWMAVDSRESDARSWTEKTMPKMLEAIRGR